MKQDVKVNFYFIRHGETNRNANGDLIGQSPNEPLNEKGKRQAQLLGKRIKKENINFEYIYVSPYIRAVDTCNIVCDIAFPDEAQYLDDLLREVNQGDGIDKSRKELYTPEFKKYLDVMGMGFKFNNGESLFEVEDRAAQWLENTLNDIDESTNVAVFTHGMVIKSLLHHIMDFDQRLTWRINIENTSITKLTLCEGKWFLNCINDYSHLRTEEK